VVREKALNPFAVFLLSVLVGIVAGLGAVAYRLLIAFFHSLLFLGQFSFFYDTSLHTPPSPWGPGVILVPVVGAIGVAFLVKNFAPEAKGTGIPEVIDAVYYKQGKIRPVIAIIKSLASALSLGSGASVGREGPITQIASSFGSMVGQIIRMPPWQRVTLVAAGAGGGIAATFNTPVGGMLFAIEIILYEMSVRTFVPLAISASTATLVSRLILGNRASFVISGSEISLQDFTHPVLLLSYAGLGVLTGLASVLLIKSIYGFEDVFDHRVSNNYYVRHMVGMFLVGIMMFVLMIGFGHYYIEDVGYSTIQNILSGTRLPLILLFLLFGAKLFATSLSLGSGASGGIFSPSLYLGATLGGLYGITLGQLIPGLEINPVPFALAGMASFVGGVTGAPMAAIVMLFEMTLSFRFILALIIAVALSYGTRKLLSKESIYTLRLVRRGHLVPETRQVNLEQLAHARDVMQKPLGVLSASSTLHEFGQISSGQTGTLPWFLVADSGRVIGVVDKGTAVRALNPPSKAARLGDLIDKRYVTVPEEMSLFDVITLMGSRNASVALVTGETGEISPQSVRGLITKEVIGDFVEKSTELFLD
jgi:CIC family chloride channel protein